MINTPHKDIMQANSNRKASLGHILKPIEPELQEFRTFYRQAIRTDVFVLDKIVQYLMRQKGKQIRPALVFLSARLYGDITERSYIAATMIELLHTATLIHDDVVDEANIRRGFLSINKIWKNKAGVLLGDFLLSKGLLIALDHDEFKLLKVLSKAVKNMSEGELRQLKAARLFNMTEDYYFKVISEKTASLFAACCECGAISASNDKEHHQLMHEVGMCIGMAFQIKDDLFDYGTDDVGKPRRNDIRERKVTLPFIKALEHASTLETARYRYLMWKRNKREKDIDAIVRFVQEKGGIRYSRKVMHEYANRAREKLSALPRSQAREDFSALISFIINRKK